MTARIIGTGSCFPDRIVTNDDLSEMIDTNDEWIYTRTGIKERRISSGETLTGLASEAAKRALENAGVYPEEIDMIITATSTPDYIFPNAASLIQAKIGAVNAAGYDLNAACSGFLFAVNTAYAFIKAGIYKKVLVIGADILSKELDWNDRSTCVLFGDGAGAAVLSAEDTGMQGMVMHGDGSKGMVLSCAGTPIHNFLTQKESKKGFFMDGQEVFKFASTQVPKSIIEVLEQSNTDLAEVSWFVLHQANIRIIQNVAKRLGIGMEKFPANLERYGNTSAGSLPILLDEMNRKGMLQKGDKIILSGFGAGLTWGASLFIW